MMKVIESKMYGDELEVASFLKEGTNDSFEIEREIGKIEVLSLVWFEPASARFSKHSTKAS